MLEEVRGRLRQRVEGRVRVALEREMEESVEEGRRQQDQQVQGGGEGPAGRTGNSQSEKLLAGGQWKLWIVPTGGGMRETDEVCGCKGILSEGALEQPDSVVSLREIGEIRGQHHAEQDIHRSQDEELRIKCAETPNPQ
ncbi:unnamed protein product [Sphagnum balticum]